MSRRRGDTEYTREHARLHFLLAVRRIRPACFIALGRATLAPAGEVEHEVRRWAQHWRLTAEWCVRWALDACRDNRNMGEMVTLPIHVNALSYGPEAKPTAPSLGVDGCPGFLRWLQQQKLADLVEWFSDSDLWELAGEEYSGAPQRKAGVSKRLKDGCSKLATRYTNAVKAHYAPRLFPEVAFDWLARRVVPVERCGEVETWDAMMPGDGEDDDPDSATVESTPRKVARALAEFIALPLPDRTDGR